MKIFKLILIIFDCIFIFFPIFFCDNGRWVYFILFYFIVGLFSLYCTDNKVLFFVNFHKFLFQEYYTLESLFHFSARKVYFY